MRPPLRSRRLPGPEMVTHPLRVPTPSSRTLHSPPQAWPPAFQPPCLYSVELVLLPALPILHSSLYQSPVILNEIHLRGSPETPFPRPIYFLVSDSGWNTPLGLRPSGCVPHSSDSPLGPTPSMRPGAQGRCRKKGVNVTCWVWEAVGSTVPLTPPL